MASVCDTVGKRIRREQAQLDLYSRDTMYGIGFTDRVCANLAQADAANLTLVN